MSTGRSRIGLIAGNGKLPFLFAESARRKGVEVVAAGIRSETEPLLEKRVETFQWMSLGQLGKLIRFFRKFQISEAVMVGQVKHPKLFDLRPDAKALKLLLKARNQTADSLLSLVADGLKKEGIRLLSSTTYLEEFVPKKGILTKRKPARKEKKDISFGLEIARAVSKVDIGQTVVIKEKTVLAVEAMEGTDECIRRAGKIRDGAVVVKTARPNQDMRFDLPTVGPGTLEALRNAKARVLAVEGGRTFFIDIGEIIREADREGICIVVV